MERNAPNRNSRVAKADFERLAAFRYTLRRFLNFSDGAVKSMGLTAWDYQGLLAIQGMPGRDYVTLGELAERLQVPASKAVELTTRLAHLGFVQRAAAGESKGSVLLQLTPTGLEKLEQLYALHCEELSKVGPQLSEVAMIASQLKR